jgi:hypothetical protein
MKKLFVAGCSFSDYTQVDKVYGEILAEKLGYEYVHEGSGCGSNYRIWRVIGGYILSGNLTPNDLLIIQYTSTERREFWSHNSPSISEPKKVNLNEPYKNNGSLLKFKSGSGAWTRFSEEKALLDLYEKYFCSVEYEQEWFKIMHNFFQTFLIHYNIKTVFLETVYSYQLKDNGLEKQFENLYFDWKKNYDTPSIQLVPNQDWGHLNIEGHELLANDLYEHLLKNNICGD